MVNALVPTSCLLLLGVACRSLSSSEGCKLALSPSITPQKFAYKDLLLIPCTHLTHELNSSRALLSGRQDRLRVRSKPAIIYVSVTGVSMVSSLFAASV